MPIFAIEYTYTDDAAARGEARPAHKNYMASLAEQGINVGSGVFAESSAPDGAMLLFVADSDEAALDLVAADPFYREGLVAEVRVRQWTPFFGPLLPYASSPAI
jgi:uncharacterized protein YciI